MEDKENAITAKKQRHPCVTCDYVATRKSHLNRHIRAKHEGVRYTCGQCKFTSVRLAYVKEHEEAIHEGKQYACDQCAFITSRLMNLNRHKMSNHSGISFICDQCERSFSSLENLKISRMHKNRRYPCSKCDYVATSLFLIKEHKKSSHKINRYLCDQCEYSATKARYVKKHKKAKHDGIRYPCDRSDKKEVSPITMKVKVMVEKLALSKYQGYLGHVQEPEFIEMYGDEKEIKTEEDIDPLSIITYDNREHKTTMVEMKNL